MIWYHLYNFKNVKKFSLFFRVNGTKSRKTSHVWKVEMVRENGGAQIILKDVDELPR